MNRDFFLVGQTAGSVSAPQARRHRGLASGGTFINKSQAGRVLTARLHLRAPSHPGKLQGQALVLSSQDCTSRKIGSPLLLVRGQSQRSRQGRQRLGCVQTAPDGLGTSKFPPLISFPSLDKKSQRCLFLVGEVLFL